MLPSLEKPEIQVIWEYKVHVVLEKNIRIAVAKMHK